MKFLVTGATGFIGSHLCAQIARAGNELLAFSATGGPLPDGAATQALDFSSAEIDSGMLASVDVVVHLAGIAHRSAGESDYQAVNHRAVVKLAEQAEQAGVRSFVFLSSVKAMGPGAGELPRNEQDCRIPPDSYGRSKRDAELALAEQFGSGDMSVCIVRPALVYGDGAKANLALLARAVNKGLPRPPAEGGRSMIGIDDLCRLILLLAGDEVPGVRTYIATDGEVYSTRRIYDALRSAGGMGQGVAWWPRWVWRVGCWLMDAGSSDLESTWQRLFGWECFSNQAAHADFGWQPQQTFEDYCRSNGGLG